MTATLPANSDERTRYEFVARMLAMKDHWPARFARLYGAAGEQQLIKLLATTPDSNRLIKLRRLALAELT